MKKSKHRYLVIMAGGTGTRLWPLSRSSSPKQFLKLVDDETLVQSTYQRVKQVLPKEQIFIMADQAKTEIAKEQLKEVLPENFIVEPEARDNGPAIIVASLLLQIKDPDAIVAILWSDHFVKKPKKFADVLESSFIAAEENPDHIISIGIKPTYPATAFGYIKLGHEVESKSKEPIFRVDQFVEKPDLKTAVTYTSDWRYLWNTGYKIYSAKHMLALVEKYQPNYHQTIKAIRKDIKTKGQEKALADHFSEFEKKDIERLITEKTDKMLVIPADLGWSDIGAWNVLHDVLTDRNGDDLVVHCEGEHIGVNSRRCLIIGKKKLIATVGLEDLVIVETDDALLIAHKSGAQDVKQIVEQLKAANKEEYL